MERAFEIGAGSTRFKFFVDAEDNVRMKIETLGRKRNGEREQLLSDCGYLCEVEITGRGTECHTGDRHMFCSESGRLKYVRHVFTEKDGEKTLLVRQEDDAVAVESRYVEYAGVDGIECVHSVVNIGNADRVLEYVSSLAVTGIGGIDNYENLRLYRSSNGWYTECQWHGDTLADLGVFCGNPVKSMKKFCVSNTGSWSTKSSLPMGILEDKTNGEWMLWQINSNTSWSYELGDIYRSVSLHVSGPTLQENNWALKLKKREKFDSVSVFFTRGADLGQVLKNVTDYRRQKAKEVIDAKMPIVFNEYMYGSWNCPTEKSAERFSRIAAEMGADYYVIDCGWHDEVDDPFYYVGKWKESKRKYPHGLRATADKVTERGMKFGLWMEPEVVGILGDAKEAFSDDCFLTRFGERICVSKRYQLDFRNEKVQRYLDGIIDRLTREFCVRYFKFDYNIEIGAGADSENGGIGCGLLENGRAYIDWLRRLRRRHPEVIFESCASGGNRLDYLTMSNSHLASTSDQTDYRLYPYIIGNMLSALLPEQAAVWVYPVSDRIPEEQIDEDCVAMNLVNGMSGRIHLASDMSGLSEDKKKLIKEGLAYYRYMIPYRAKAYPWLPNGFCRWGEDRLAFGLDCGEKKFLFVYDLGGEGRFTIPVGKCENVVTGYPKHSPLNGIYADGNLTVSLDGRFAAVVFELN